MLSCMAPSQGSKQMIDSCPERLPARKDWYTYSSIPGLIFVRFVGNRFLPLALCRWCRPDSPAPGATPYRSRGNLSDRHIYEKCKTNDAATNHAIDIFVVVIVIVVVLQVFLGTIPPPSVNVGFLRRHWVSQSPPSHASPDY